MCFNKAVVKGELGSDPLYATRPGDVAKPTSELEYSLFIRARRRDIPHASRDFLGRRLHRLGHGIVMAGIDDGDCRLGVLCHQIKSFAKFKTSWLRSRGFLTFAVFDKRKFSELICLP